MWGRRKRKDDEQPYVPQPERSYWDTHPEGSAQPPTTLGTTSLQLTVDGKSVDPDSAQGHFLLEQLAKRGKVTEHHVVQTTKHANPDQQKQITELLLQKRAGTLSDDDFARQVLAIMTETGRSTD